MDGCAPCKLLTQQLEARKDELPADFKVETFNISTDMGMDMAARFGIRAAPTMVCVDETGSVIGEPLIGQPMNAVKWVNSFY